MTSVLKCARCGFDASPEHFRGDLCAMCADPCCAIEAIGHLHHVYDRHKTLVQYKQRVMTLDAFYEERRVQHKGSKRQRASVKASEFAVISPVYRSPSTKRGARLS